jgi:hypothetical protein
VLKPLIIDKMRLPWTFKHLWKIVRGWECFFGVAELRYDFGDRSYVLATRFASLERD